MLSRDAEHLYWLSRYVERVENTARLINVNSELMLDFPGDKTLGWQSIIETLDNLDIYQRIFIWGGFKIWKALVKLFYHYRWCVCFI